MSLVTAFGQSVTVTLSGTIQDESGAVIPDVKVTVTNMATTLQREATTTREGYFVIPLLPPGTYVARFEREGFAPLEAKDIVLNVNDQRALLIQLDAMLAKLLARN